MNQYMNHPGKLVHANNKYYFEAELNHAKWWKSFEFYDENNNKLNTVVTKDDTSKISRQSVSKWHQVHNN